MGMSGKEVLWKMDCPVKNMVAHECPYIRKGNHLFFRFDIAFGADLVKSLIQEILRNRRPNFWSQSDVCDTTCLFSGFVKPDSAFSKRLSKLTAM